MPIEKKLHFISMDVPFPPKYGGIIDVYFKLKAFHQLGVKIYLHLFGNSTDGIEDLKPLAEEIYFYPIKKNPVYFLHPFPFSVKSRSAKELLKNIKKHQVPLFFESLKTTQILHWDVLCDYPKYLRLHNIEQNYFEGLAKSESDKLKRKMFQVEARKYVKYESIISQMDEVFTLSIAEQQLIERKYNKGMYVPVFHGNSKLPYLEPFGKFVLYHGDLRAADNCKAVEYLIDVFKDLDYPLVIASSTKEDWVKSKIRAFQNIKFIYLNDFHHLLQLFNQAHINIAWSFQASGTKLKVINALFNSRYSIINANIIDDKKVSELCFSVESTEELIEKIDQLMHQSFQSSIQYRDVLENYLNDIKNAETILHRIFP